MARRPIIGIATQTQDAIPGQSPQAWVMGQRYVRALTAEGAVPWVIPLLQDDLETMRAIYDQIDGLFLTGGVDVDPSQYGEDRHPLCGKTDPPRDCVELQLIRWAMEELKPVLGVCRGIQAINVACGGTLYQDVGAQHPAAIKHDYFPSPGGFTRDQIVHAVQVRHGTRLRAILGEDEIAVNSLHHQGIKRLAPGLVASVFAPDQLIEGIEGSNGHYLVGVQWHPEELAERTPAMRRLFASLLSAVREYRRA